MTIFLLILMAVVLIFLGITLMKQTVFFSLIENNEKNSRFLKTYGLIYLVLGVISALLATVNQMLFILAFIAVMMLVSALFSIQFSKKMR
ncbi:hypothetical protein [Enterococcus saccharolyticus]|uniref:Uncharacterized protein n=1 Tax=Enterococcus saccharolyticus subsp. saccharolyticus ATCC 43076 TaxID=1139996 RepID=S0NQM7_9ENTE|nr:hypothetical protein [Enterococcus saccharolyticus]EOT30614.1 hypothetical protein OMQ_00318 [Enterococcus saccharolyticus subsp. saccharolyticus ATCC 43076]EOT80175.1 hypothetical protein I572_00700 [Enterococcus saccharolyticus subsp. saccharolyticus ATCC 43076]OJG87986.1 hypothetical protein RV16_GL000507 [Enterococcus saccharolyticus]